MLQFPGNIVQFNYQAYLELYQEARQLKIKNQNLQRALNQSQMQIINLQTLNQSLIAKAQVKIQHQQQPNTDRKTLSSKPRRRKRNDNVDGIHQCPYDNCPRTYGTSLALNLHIKLKHNGGSKKQRQRAAKKIIECQQKGQIAPKYYINFPPYYIENYRQLMKAKKSF